MITCQLSKPESTLDAIRKSYPKLKPTDAALLTTSLVISGRHAIANYDNHRYEWTKDVDGLTKALLIEVKQAQGEVEGPTKKTSKVVAEEEPVIVGVDLIPNYEAASKMLLGRKDLETLLSDLLEKGVEYVFGPADIGWQWALDRVNWVTLSEGDVHRKVRIRTTFTQGSVGIELGTTAPKKRATKAAKSEAAEPAPTIEEAD
ncbi:MAG: hypothetical protein HONBIEJF_00177 [Fimbriimonadaceae bacterium]|nr:hypothetical protein [Fimbriimonadaceae bacterium]